MPGEPAPDTAVEIVVDLGFTTELPGFQCEGIAWRPDGTIIKAISPRNQYIPLKLLGSGMAVDFYVEAAANPDVAQGWTFAATPYGDKATAGKEPQYRLGSIAIAELNQTVWELQQDVWTLSGLMHELPMELPRRHEILRALERMMDIMDPDDVAGTAAAGRAGPGRGAVPPCLRLGPSAGGHRPRAHRLRLAVAGPGNHPQMCPDVFQRGGPDGRGPGLRVLLLLRAAARLDEGVLPGAVRPDPREGQGRPVRSRGRHVGGIGHQHARRRGHGPAVRRGQGLLPRGIRRRMPGSLAAGFLRVLRSPAADRQGGRQPLVPDPEDLLEPDQPDAAPHLQLGRHRRHPALHALPAGGHLQLRAQRPRTGARRAELP